MQDMFFLRKKYGSPISTADYFNKQISYIKRWSGQSTPFPMALVMRTVRPTSNYLNHSVLCQRRNLGANKFQARQSLLFPWLGYGPGFGKV